MFTPAAMRNGLLLFILSASLGGTLNATASDNWADANSKDILMIYPKPDSQGGGSSGNTYCYSDVEGKTLKYLLTLDCIATGQLDPEWVYGGLCEDSTEACSGQGQVEIPVAAIKGGPYHLLGDCYTEDLSVQRILNFVYVDIDSVTPGAPKIVADDLHVICEVKGNAGPPGGSSVGVALLVNGNPAGATFGEAPVFDVSPELIVDARTTGTITATAAYEFDGVNATGKKGPVPLPKPSTGENPGEF